HRIPIEVVADQSGDKVADEGTDVDAHVEDVVPGVAQLAPGWIEVTQKRGDVRFEGTVAKDDQPEGNEQHHLAGEGQAKIASHHQHGADHDGLATAEQPISNQPTDEGGDVD